MLRALVVFLFILTFSWPAQSYAMGKKDKGRLETLANILPGAAGSYASLGTACGTILLDPFRNELRQTFSRYLTVESAMNNLKLFDWRYDIAGGSRAACDQVQLDKTRKFYQSIVDELDLLLIKNGM